MTLRLAAGLAATRVVGAVAILLLGVDAAAMVSRHRAYATEIGDWEDAPQLRVRVPAS